MANKKERPAIENPLANMGLDEIVRGITSPEVVEKPVENKPKETKKRSGDAPLMKKQEITRSLQSPYRLSGLRSAC